MVLILCIPAFIKNEYCSFLGAGRNHLLTLRVNNEINHELLYKAIEHIKQKTEIVSETNPISPFENTPSVFELTQYHILGFLNKSNLRVYEDKMIYCEKSLVCEIVNELEYSELSEKIQTIMIGDNNWGNLFIIWFLFMCFATIFIISFLPQLLKLDLIYPYLILFGFNILIPLWFMQFAKKERLVFLIRTIKVFIG